MNCPECDAPLAAFAPDTIEGELLPCPDCGAELEVVSVSPPAVALAPSVEEDWGE
ncbi:lysine biosynthesis protein LysW [Deinococcus sp. RL]|uniref:lysine biosynthesis protein LysW n=1 Tax=Deinococcus sp. RL TaxID=1489678 RepID=UPI0009DD63E1|nr:lysine biosynthesis protein LysW [Deinococcus sp. RL]